MVEVIAVLFVTLFLGFSFNVVGVLYLGDIVMLLGGSVCLIFMARQRIRCDWVMMAPLLLPLCGLALDVANGINYIDLVKGLARNAIFSCSILTAVVIGYRYGLVILLWWYCALCSGLLVSSALNGLLTSISFTSILKFYGGASVYVMLGLCLLRFPLAQIALSLLICGLSFVVFDSRGQGAVWLLVGAVAFVVRLRPSLFHKYYYILSAVALAGLVSISAYVINRTNESEFEKRREASNAQRADMALDAWAGFKSHPFLGNGSWQHARNYVDSVNPELVLGVHSYVLQFSYEYGVFGLVYGVGLICILLVRYRGGFLKLSQGYVTPGIFYIFTYLVIVSVYAVVNSPFAGYARLSVGVAIGIVIAYGGDIFINGREDARYKPKASLR